MKNICQNSSPISPTLYSLSLTTTNLFSVSMNLYHMNCIYELGFPPLDSTYNRDHTGTSLQSSD